jgi:aquaporin Z
MKKYIVEFIGTYFLMLIIGCTIIGGLGQMAPLVIGLGLIALVYAGGHISGAHYNPAVTVGLCLRGACAWSDFPGYIAAQLIGAGLAAYTVSFLLGSFAEAPEIEVFPGIVSEMLGTFALVFVILNVATAKRNAGNSFYGLAIGVTVIAITYSFGNISGGAFNPAVALGAAMMHLLSFKDIWIHVAGSVAGGIIATYVFLYVNGSE